jgi:hypothetical protein
VKTEVLRSKIDVFLTISGLSQLKGHLTIIRARLHLELP